MDSVFATLAQRAGRIQAETTAATEIAHGQYCQGTRDIPRPAVGLLLRYRVGATRPIGRHCFAAVVTIDQEAEPQGKAEVAASLDSLGGIGPEENLDAARGQTAPHDPGVQVGCIREMTDDPYRPARVETRRQSRRSWQVEQQAPRAAAQDAGSDYGSTARG